MATLHITINLPPEAVSPGPDGRCGRCDNPCAGEYWEVGGFIGRILVHRCADCRKAEAAKQDGKSTEGAV